MKVNEREILRLISELENIKNKKLSEWLTKAKNHLPGYVAEYLYMKKTGVVSQMIFAETEEGLVYDPTILRQGIDMLMTILEGQNYGHDTSRLKMMYSNFADGVTRISYLKSIIDQLDIYPTIGDELIKDIIKLKEDAQTTEELEFLENYQRNIQARKPIQEAERKERLAKQKQ